MANCLDCALPVHVVDDHGALCLRCMGCTPWKRCGYCNEWDTQRFFTLREVYQLDFPDAPPPPATLVAPAATVTSADAVATSLPTPDVVVVLPETGIDHSFAVPLAPPPGNKRPADVAAENSSVKSRRVSTAPPPTESCTSSSAPSVMSQSISTTERPSPRLNAHLTVERRSRIEEWVTSSVAHSGCAAAPAPARAESYTAASAGARADSRSVAPPASTRSALSTRGGQALQSRPPLRPSEALLAASGHVSRIKDLPAPPPQVRRVQASVARFDPPTPAPRLLPQAPIVSSLLSVFGEQTASWRQNNFFKPNQWPAACDCPFDASWYKTRDAPAHLDQTAIDPDICMLAGSDKAAASTVPPVFNYNAVYLRRILAVSSFLDQTTDALLMHASSGRMDRQVVSDMIRAVGEATSHVALNAAAAMANVDLMRRQSVLTALPPMSERAYSTLRGAPFGGQYLFNVDLAALRASDPTFPTAPLSASAKAKPKAKANQSFRAEKDLDKPGEQGGKRRRRHRGGQNRRIRGGKNRKQFRPSANPTGGKGAE